MATAVLGLSLVPAGLTVLRWKSNRAPHHEPIQGLVADFNGDGFGDLAVGVPGKDVKGHADAGAVNVNEARWFLAISLRYQGRLDEALGETKAFRRGGAGGEHIPPGANRIKGDQGL